MFSTPVRPISSESVLRQEDVDRWPHLKGIRIAEIDARVGLLIGHDVPKALEPSRKVRTEVHMQQELCSAGQLMTR